jgi:hypothetical protein
LADRLSVKAVGLILTVPGYDSLFFRGVGAKTVWKRKSASRSIVDRRNVTLVVSTRYDGEETGDIVEGQLRQSIAQSVNDRYSRFNVAEVVRS